MTKRDSQLREYASEAADIVTRLRDRAYSFKAPDPLLEEAADEIERLRQFDRLQPIEPADATPATHTTHAQCSVQGKGTLTDEEREAIECFAKAEWTNHRWSKVEKYSTTLRNLLERLQ
jgi:hypothetical protein